MGPLRDRVGAEPRAGLVEEDVAARPERVLEVHVPVAGVLVAAPAVRAHPEESPDSGRSCRVGRPLLERGDRGERLERRAGVVVLLDRAEQLGLQRIGVDRRELGPGDAARHLVRIRRRPVDEREQEPGLRVHRQDDAGGGGERLLRELLQAPVDGEDEVVARHARHDPLVLGDEVVRVLLAPPLRVDRHALLAVDAAQLTLEPPLEPAASGVVAEQVRSLPRLRALHLLVEPLQLVRPGLVHVADEVPAEPAVAVVPVRDRLHVHARQVHLVREEPVELLPRDVDLHGERPEALELARPRELPARALHLVRRHREHRREAREDLVALLAAEVRGERDVVRRPRVDEDPPVAIEDVAAIRRLADLLHEVLLGLLLVLVALQDLQDVQAPDEREEREDGEPGRPGEPRPEVLLRHAGRAGRDEGHLRLSGGARAPRGGTPGR